MVQGSGLRVRITLECKYISKGVHTHYSLKVTVKVKNRVNFFSLRNATTVYSVPGWW